MKLLLREYSGLYVSYKWKGSDKVFTKIKIRKNFSPRFIPDVKRYPTISSVQRKSTSMGRLRKKGEYYINNLLYEVEICKRSKKTVTKTEETVRTKKERD